MTENRSGPVPLDAQAARISQFVEGYGGLWVMYIGRELNLFERIGQSAQGVSDRDLARRTGLDPSYVKAWCQAAFSYELLEHADTGYVLAPHIKTLLVDRGSPFFQGGTIDIFAARSPDFFRYPERCASGETISTEERDEKLTKAAGELTRHLPFLINSEVVARVPAVRDNLERESTVLDVGCGSGLAAIYLAQVYPNCYVTGLDIDSKAIEEAQSNIAESGLEDRITLVSESAQSMNYREEFDLIYMATTLHEIEDKEGTLSSCHRALKIGGHAIVVEVPYPAEISGFRTPAGRRKTAHQLIEVSMGESFLTSDEVVRLLSGAGFHDVLKTELAGGMIGVFVVQKGENEDRPAG